MNLDDYSFNEIKKLLVEKYEFKLTHYYSDPQELTFEKFPSDDSNILVFVAEGNVSIIFYDNDDKQVSVSEDFKLSFVDFDSNFRKACDEVIIKYAEAIINQNLLNLKQLENLSNGLCPKIDLK